MKGSWNNSSKTLSESDRIKQLLVRVGDEGPTYYKRDISKLSANLLTYYQKGDQEANETALNLLVECIGELTQKTSIYATLVTLISTKNSQLPEIVIDKLIEKLRISLGKGDYHVLRSTLIFLGELMNMGMFNAFIYINILFDFFHEAEQSFDTAADYFLFTGIPVLPYVIDNLREKSRIELNSLLQNIQTLMNRRQNGYLKVLKINKEQQTFSSRLDVLWKEIKQHIETGKKADLVVLSKPYDEFKDELAAVKEIKKNIKIPFGAKNSKLCIYQSPPYYSFFGSENLNQETHSTLNLIILQDRIVDILMTFYKSRKMAAQFLLKLAEQHNCPRLVVEGVLNEMFVLPTSHSKLVFYTGVLISLIKESPESSKEFVTKIIHEQINTIFKNCEKYDWEILERFAEFFAHFISNLNFEWDWTQWKFVTDLDSTTIEVILFKAILVRLVQISFFDRISEILPEELRPFLPAKEPTFYEYDQPESANANDAQIIKDKFNSKPTVDEMNEFLTSEDSGLEVSNEQLLDLFVQTMLNRGSKTLTHLNAHFDKYHPTIAHLTNSESDQHVILEATRKIFRNSHFHTILTISILQKYKLVDAKNIIEWVFKAIEKEDDPPNNFNIHWEVLLATLAKATSDVEVLRSEIQRAEENKEDTSDSVKRLETLQETRQEVFTLVFEKLNNLIKEVFSDNEKHTEATINLLILIARKYRKEIDGIYAKIEEDFAEVGNNELKDKLSHIRELRFREE